MTSRDFCYWLQGFFELTERGKDEARPLDSDQVLCIKRHLHMVFKHEIDPSHGDAAHQAILSQAHQGGAAGDAGKPIARC